MKKIISEWKSFLNESSLSRIWKWMENYETAFISASRSDKIDEDGVCTANAIAPGADDPLRNRDLKASLLGLGYRVTPMVGSYVEGFKTNFAKEVKERSFFVVNFNDKPDFFNDLTTLSEKFCQDSVALCPKGGIDCFLRGTNNNPYPGFGQEEVLGHPIFGQESQFMSKVGGRPISIMKEDSSITDDIKFEIYEDLTRMQRMAVMAITERVLKD